MQCNFCSKEATYEVTFYDGKITYLCEEHYKNISQDYEDEISYVNQLKRTVRFSYSIRGE
jgi:hypothetical protein